jgi:hydrogenase maturation protease
MNCNAADPQSPASAAGRVLVIGYGNTLRGDDAFGPIVADRLRSTADSERVHILTCHQLTPELACDIAACEHVIFIDASIASPAGELVCRDLAAGEADAGSLVHSLRPEQLLALTRLVYGRQPSASLVCVGGTRFDLGDHQLSPTVAVAIEPALERVRELIDRRFARG